MRHCDIMYSTTLKGQGRREEAACIYRDVSYGWNK
jgi:hypothetical protein